MKEVDDSDKEILDEIDSMENETDTQTSDIGNWEYYAYAKNYGNKPKQKSKSLWNKIGMANILRSMK